MIAFLADKSYAPSADMHSNNSNNSMIAQDEGSVSQAYTGFVLAAVHLLAISLFNRLSCYTQIEQISLLPADIATKLLAFSQRVRGQAQSHERCITASVYLHN